MSFLALGKSIPLFFTCGILLDSALVGDFCPCHFFYFPERLLAFTSMCHIGKLVKNDSFGPRSDLQTCVSRMKLYRIEE